MKGWLDNYNDYNVSAPEEMKGDGFSNVGRNSSSAWGGQFQMGGNLPGAVGNMYARTGSPSKGPRRNQTDVTDASAQNGTEMQYYQNGLDWKPKTISQDGVQLDKAQVGKKVKFDPKKFKLKDERESAYKTAESTNVKKKNFDLEQSKSNKSYINQLAEQQKENKRRKALTQDQREREDYNARNEERGSIQAPVKESTWDRTKAIASNPLTAFGYAARNQSLPARFQHGERNVLDNAIDWVNPLQGVAAVSEIPGELGRGEYLNAGLSLLDAADLGVYAKGAMKASKPLLQKAGQQLGNVRTNIAPELRQGLATQGFPNPLGIVDSVTPRINPLSFIEDGPDMMSFSPLNWIPGYGKKLSGTKDQAFRKFGNSIQDVIERKALSPAGGSKFRLGKDKIVSEGNWAAQKNPWEKYSGVFEATFDRKAPNNNISFAGYKDRSGVLIKDAQGNFLPEIPLTEPGMQLNRRLPFSTKYVPINKEKLINNEFQLATQLPHLQSLAEKYGILAGGAGAAGYFAGGSEGAKENINTLNKYTIDPLINFAKPYYNQVKEEFNRQTGNKKDGGVIKDDMGYWNPDNWDSPVEIGSNEITMKYVPFDVLGISDTGDTKLMKPGKNYKFKGKKVTEYPMAKNGLRQEQKGLQNIDNLTNFTNYNKPTVGGWLNKYN